MGETPTQRYVDAILEATGLLRKGRLNPKGLEKIRRMDDRETRIFADSLHEQVQDHYKRNLPSILKGIEGKDKKAPQQKGIYYVPPSPIKSKRELPDLFLRKAALYYDKLILEDPLESTLFVRGAFTPKRLKEILSIDASSWLLLKPWVNMKLVESIPPPTRVWEGIEPAVERLADEDWIDERWERQVLIDKDYGLKGEALIKDFESFIQASITGWYIRTSGDLREYALRVIARGSSANVSEGVFGAGFLGGGCVPTTDIRQAWKLLGFWLRRRTDLVVRGGLLDRDYAERLKAGAALPSLEAPKLGFLEGLKPSQIGELRTSDDYRFQDFRRKWTEVCRELKRMPWDPDFQKEANQLWTEEIMPEVEIIRKDLTIAKAKLAAQGFISSLGIVTTLVPGLTWVGLVATILPLLVPGASIPETLKRLKAIRTDDKNDTYFLLAAEEKAIDYSRI